MAQIERARANIAAGLAANSAIPWIDPVIAELTPIQIMQIGAREAAQRGDWKAASTLAAMAAPYCHPRLQNISIRDETTQPINAMTTEELEARLAKLNIIDADYEEPEQGS